MKEETLGGDEEFLLLRFNRERLSTTTPLSVAPEAVIRGGGLLSRCRAPATNDRRGPRYQIMRFMKLYSTVFYSRPSWVFSAFFFLL